MLLNEAHLCIAVEWKPFIVYFFLLFVLTRPLQMFDNISQLRFTTGSSQEEVASAMLSGEGEEMVFRTGVVVEGKVEDWMTCVLNEMRRTNQLITKESVYRYCDQKSRYVLCNTECKITCCGTYSVHCYQLTNDLQQQKVTDIHSLRCTH